MAKKRVLIAVDEIPGRRGRASKAGPALEEFLGSKMKAARVDADAWGAQAASIVISLRNYAKANELPVRVIVRGDDVYLQRTAKK